MVGYGEARISFNYPGREIEGVSIIELSAQNQCVDGYTEEHLEACISKDICVQSKYQCKADISNKYKRMLNQEPSALHYLHYKGQNQPLNGLIMMWGLTKNESKEACEYFLKKYSRARKLKNYSVTCI